MKALDNPQAAADWQELWAKKYAATWRETNRDHGDSRLLVPVRGKAIRTCRDVILEMEREIAGHVPLR